MVGLRTFGGFDVDLDGALGRAACLRPRIIALLALLIGYGPRGLSRDKILAYLWPESDTDHARNSLKQALFSLRHAFSDPIVLWSSGLLRLNPQLVEADLWSFESALAKGQEHTAVSLYRGPFLDGFYVSGLAEFERWAELERERLAAAYRGALKTLAVRAEAAADWPAAMAWWRRLTQCEPYLHPGGTGTDAGSGVGRRSDRSGGACIASCGEATDRVGLPGGRRGGLAGPPAGHPLAGPPSEAAGGGRRTRCRGFRTPSGRAEAEVGGARATSVGDDLSRLTTRSL